MIKDAGLLSTSLLDRMAHDIRGPVGVVGFLLEELATGEPTSQQREELLGRGRRSLQRLLQVADRLSRAALLATDDLELSFSRLELRVLLRDCVAVAVNAERRAEVELRLALGVQPIFTDMDARWLSAALSDTVMTFIRRARSAVEITIGGSVDGPLRITLSHDGLRTQNEPDLCSNLPITMLAATARRHGWTIDVSPSQASADGLLQGGQIVIEIGAARHSDSAPRAEPLDNAA